MSHLNRREAITVAAVGGLAVVATPTAAAESKPIRFEITSADTKRTYNISATVPTGAATPKHPVVYLLDGHRHSDSAVRHGFRFDSHREQFLRAADWFDR
jgi:hypothetical protein